MSVESHGLFTNGFERGVTRSDEAHGRCGMFGTAIGLEIGHGGGQSFWATRAPLGEETDSKATEHAQHPDGVTVADTALIFVG